MKIAVLGGLGLQGKAALADLSKSEAVEEVICADVNLDAWEKLKGIIDTKKVSPLKVNASSKDALAFLLRQDVDVVIDLLPVGLMPIAFEAAIEAGVPLVGTNYGHSVRHLNRRAVTAGVSLMPECGLDPGIDLIICGHGVKQFDEVQSLNCYCGGFPERKACDNPLGYKVTWNWDLVLRTQKRESVFIKDGHRLTVPAAEQHDTEMIHKLDFPGLGQLEAVPNGDAVFYTDLLDVTDTIRDTGRYALRWPGWCAFWRPLKRLGFLSDTALDVNGSAVSPHQFLVRLIEPQIQYREDEKDIVAMCNVFEGVKEKRKKRIVSRLLIERDLETGLFAMNMGVGYTASIVAQMICRGEINRKGILSPALDVPYEPFMKELSKRGILVEEEVDYEV